MVTPRQPSITASINLIFLTRVKLFHRIDAAIAMPTKLSKRNLGLNQVIGKSSNLGKMPLCTKVVFSLFHWGRLFIFSGFHDRHRHCNEIVADFPHLMDNRQAYLGLKVFYKFDGYESIVE